MLVAVLSRIVDRGDARMVQSGQHLCLAPKPLLEGTILSRGAPHDFHGYGAAQAGGEGSIDHGHPAATDLFLQAISSSQHHTSSPVPTAAQAASTRAHSPPDTTE